MMEAGAIEQAADEIADEIRDGDRVDDVEQRAEDEVRRRYPLASDADRSTLTDAVRARLGGLDRLDPLLHDREVDEILVGGGAVWVERHGEVRRVGSITDTATRRVIERVIAPLGRRLDRTSPIVDARLPDGSRVCAVVEPIAVDGPTLSIRRFAERIRTLDEFLDPTTAPSVRRCCEELIASRRNVLVSGATSSGKTSLLATLLARADPLDRVVLLEDVAELPCASPHRLRLEARPPTIDGPPPIDLERLVRTALRLRPDRIVVGEVRGDEALALLQAMNTGHDGSLSSIHANSATDALLRLETLVVRAAPRWPLDAVRHTIRRSLDHVIHVDRVGGRRVISEIGEVTRGTRDDAPLSVTSAIDGGDGDAR